MTDLQTSAAPAQGEPMRISSLPLVLRSSIITIGMLALLLLWPAAILRRYQEIQASTLDFQLRPEDPVLVICGVLWLALIATLMGSFRPLRSFPGIGELQASLRRTVADSYFGLGHYRGWTYTNPDASLAQLEAPDPDAASAIIPGWSDGPDRSVTVAKGAAPNIVAVVAETPAVVQTTPYIVQRRDSWWSISESITGEAKHWNLIRDLNVGREVADGITIDADTPLRSGWEIVVPADPAAL